MLGQPWRRWRTRSALTRHLDQAGILADTLETILEADVTALTLWLDTQRATAEAMASASIGQVHEATLRDGTRVVVKVQHPGIEDRIQNDLEILGELAELAELRRQLALPAAVEGEALHAVVEAVGHAGEHRPPVPRRPGGRARLGDRITEAPA